MCCTKIDKIFCKIHNGERGWPSCCLYVNFYQVIWLNTLDTLGHHQYSQNTRSMLESEANERLIKKDRLQHFLLGFYNWLFWPLWQKLLKTLQNEAIVPLMTKKIIDLSIRPPYFKILCLETPCKTWLFHKTFCHLVCYCFSCVSWVWVSQTEKQLYFDFDSGKNVTS